METSNYAFIKNGEVVNVAVFQEPINLQLLEHFKNTHSLDEIILATEKARPGGTYDGAKFWIPQPYPSWIKNEELNEWEAPVSYPEDGLRYKWNEEILNWEEIQLSE